MSSEGDAPMRTRCPACDLWVDAFGAGDNTVTIDRAVYHGACIDVKELTNDELAQVDTPEAENELQNRAERAEERSFEAYHGGGSPVTMSEMHEKAWKEKQRLR